jgi:hypothetical protein
LEDAKAGLHYSIQNTREEQELLAVKPPNVKSNLEVSKKCAFLCDFPGLQSKCKDGFRHPASTNHFGSLDEGGEGFLDRRKIGYLELLGWFWIARGVLLGWV